MVGRNVTVSGPLFDGRAAKAVRDFCNEFPYKFAGDGVDQLQERFALVFENRTGAYESQVRHRRLSSRTSAITSDSPYGPWLEGKGSRNKISSFKGYHSFGWVRLRMEQTIEPAGNLYFQRYLRRMN